MKSFNPSPSVFDRTRLGMTALTGALVLLAGCSDDDNDMPAPAPETMVQFEVSVTNLTAGQPLSPLALVAHQSGWKAFSTGAPASEALEMLAESGDNGPLIMAATEDTQVLTTASGAGILTPGSTESLSFTVAESALGTLSLSLVSMLVNTNDAIAALNDASLATLAAGESASFMLNTYDTGTEANTESADTVPGPAATGGAREGFNAARDDVRDAVYVHAGVVTADDGLLSSTLSAAHRWDHPALQVHVSRLN